MAGLSRFLLQGRNPLHCACWNFHADVAEYLLDNTRIDPLAKDKDGDHALLLSLKDDLPRDQGLPILELFHRKAPQALDMPAENGKNLGSMQTFCDISRTEAMLCDRSSTDPLGSF